MTAVVAMAEGNIKFLFTGRQVKPISFYFCNSNGFQKRLLNPLEYVMSALMCQTLLFRSSDSA